MEYWVFESHHSNNPVLHHSNHLDDMHAAAGRRGRLIFAG